MKDHDEHEEIEETLKRIENKLDSLIRKVEQMSATLDQVLQDVQDESTVADSLVALFDGIQQQLKDALAGSGISSSTQAKIDAIFAGVEANKAKLAAAVTANTPVAGSGAVPNQAQIDAFSAKTNPTPNTDQIARFKTNTLTASEKTQFSLPQ